MVQAQYYLDHYYPYRTRNTVSDLNLSNKNLTGDLNISNFFNLQKLDYSTNPNLSNVLLGKEILNTLEDYNISSSNRWGKWSLVDFSQIKKFDCSNNSLEKIDASTAQKLTYLDVSNNLLLELDLPINSENLQVLNCSNNPNLARVSFNSSLNPISFDCLGITFNKSSESSLNTILAVFSAISVLSWLVLGLFFYYNKYQRREKISKFEEIELENLNVSETD